MAIFSLLASFFKRHKRKIIFAAGAAILTYFLVNELVVKRFRNFQNSLRQELMFKQQIKQRFIQTQQDCYYTVLALLPVLTTPIFDYLPVEVVTQALKVKKQPGAHNANAQLLTAATLTPDNLQLLEKLDATLLQYVGMLKAELWLVLKIKTITRTLTLVYSITALLLLTRLQLNILARRLYLEAAIQMAGVKGESQGDGGDVYATEQAYLLLSWWLLNKGWKYISDAIEPLVVAKFDLVNPKLEFTIPGFMSQVSEILDDLSPQQLMSLMFPVKFDDLMETLANTTPRLMDELEVTDLNFSKLIQETTLIITDNVYCVGLFKLLIHQMLATLQYNLQINLDKTLPLANLSLLALLMEEASQLFAGNGTQYKLATYLAQLLVQNGVMADNNNATPDDEDDIEGFIAKLTQGGQDELTGNIYVNTINDSEELDDFSAGIYSNFE